MPFKSEAQRKWAYTKEGIKALGGMENVHEWEKATGDRKLPKYANDKGGDDDGRRDFRRDRRDRRDR